MTSEDIAKARAIYGPFKKFPIYFVDCPEANILLDMLPQALDEVERLQSDLSVTVAANHQYAIEHCKLVAERTELRAVAEAAEKLVARNREIGGTLWHHKTLENAELALKAWRGEPGTDANGSPV